MIHEPVIIVFGGTKGGPGKTTDLLNCAVELAHQGYRILLIDGDKQRNLAKWHHRRVANGHEPRMTLVEKRGDMAAAIADLAPHYDYVFVDVGGDDNIEMRTAMAVAHKLVVVMRPSQFDAETLEEFTPIIKQARVFNPKLEVRALLSQVPTYDGEDETEDVLEYMAGFDEVVPLKAMIAHRKRFRDSVGEGLGVIEMPHSSRSQGAAKREVAAVVKELIG